METIGIYTSQELLGGKPTFRSRNPDFDFIDIFFKDRHLVGIAGYTYQPNEIAQSLLVLSQTYQIPAKDFQVILGKKLLKQEGYSREIIPLETIIEKGY